MKQYHDAKRQYRDAILFFRMGDFYEMFFEDALVAARALELTLTSRSKDSAGGAIPMCGVPYHALDGYLARLVRKGYRVAICEQVEDPKKAKGVVKREVVRVVSPRHAARRQLPRGARAGVSDEHHARPRRPLGVALIDLTTGEFSTTEYSGPGRWQALEDELRVLRPRELVVAEDADLAASARSGAHRRATDARRAMAIRSRRRAPGAGRAVQDAWARRLRP